MDLTLSPDQRALQQGLREVLADLWSAERLRTASNGDGVVRAGDPAWRQLAELGVLGVLADEADGGMGLGLADAAVLFEELGAALVPGPLVATVLAAPFVPGCADGSAVVTTLDLTAATLLAEHLDGATHVVLVGEDDVRIAAADQLDATVLARPLDPLTPVCAVSSPDAPGDVVEGLTAADWRRRGAVLTAALQVGIARGGLELAVRYATERVQFDRAVGSFQSIKHLLAEQLVRVDLARAASWVAALSCDDVDVATAKVLADDAAVTGGRTCVQVHGGMGFTWEVLAHLYVKRAWVHETAYGTADEHALALAGALS